MKAIISLFRLPHHLVRLAQERRGVAAVEFAMLLPLMVTLYLGSVEISQGVGINRKVTLTTRTVADLASQVSSINNADMTNILNASSAVIAPYSVSNLKVTVSEVSIDANGNATITWSDSLNGGAHSVGQAVTVPASLKLPNTSLILGEVQYAYNPTFGYVLTGILTLKSQMYMAPRMTSTVTRLNS